MSILRRFFGRRSDEPDRETRVALCTLSKRFTPDMESDAACFERHYSNARREVIDSIESLDQAVRDADFVLVYATVDPEGSLICGNASDYRSTHCWMRARRLE
jgi:hypothetical protein